MKAPAILLIIAATVLCVAAPEAQAAGRRRRLERSPGADQVEKTGHPQSAYIEGGPIHRSAPLDPRAVYPKYQGGFHSRALQNIGVPTGDIGIRGNGFMMNPW